MNYHFIFLFLLFSGFMLSQQRKTPEHYSYLLEDSYNPLTVRINIVLLQRSDGSGNYDLSNPEEKAVLDDYLTNLNYVYSNLVQPADLTGCYTGNDFIKDTKIRFKFNVIEVKNEFAWNYLNSGAQPEEKKFSGFIPYENWYIKPLDDSISLVTQNARGINVYFTSNGEKFDEIVREKATTFEVASNEASQFPTNTNLERSSQVHVPNRYLKYILHRYRAPIIYNTTWDETRNWHISAKGIGHELGHSFGLGHTNEYHKSNTCTYTIMSQKGNHARNYLQPTEIKKIHWNLTRTNLMQFVTEDSHYGVSWKIEEDTIWDKPRRFYNDFELEENVTLTISDKIILPPQAQIKLNKGAQIIFKGKGEVVDAMGERFSNFDLHKKSQVLYLD